MSTTVAIIGGSGLASWPGAECLAERVVATPYGETSAALRHLRVLEAKDKAEFLFLPRHGDKEKTPPHRVNYRANLWALQSAGATQVLAVNAVGGIGPACGTGELVLPDQIIDYTWGRKHTYYDGDDGRLDHIEFGEPYSTELRSRLIACAAQSGQALVERGTYGATQGPRLETAAEVRRLQRDGCDLVGMTGMPEAALARELGLEYASLCLVVNPAAGLSEEPITLEDIRRVLETGMDAVRALLVKTVASLDGGSS